MIKTGRFGSAELRSQETRFAIYLGGGRGSWLLPFSNRGPRRLSNERYRCARIVSSDYPASGWLAMPSLDLVSGGN